jgi:hypothetical protein
MDLVYFILSAYGLTQILAYGTIFDKVRPPYKFFRCPMCLGFWVGAFLFGINQYTELFTFEYNLVNLFLLGWLSSGTSYVLCTVFGDDGVKYEHKLLDR